MNINEVTLLFLAVIIALLLFVAHKSRRIHLAQFQINERFAALQDAINLVRDLSRETAQIYTQLQNYTDLVRLISPVRSLPSLRGWAASPDFLLLVAEHTLDAKPRAILECSSGASTLVLARCCQIIGSGHVFSLEHDSHYAIKTRQLLSRHGLEAWATVIDAPLRTSDEIPAPWYSLDGLPESAPPFELLVIDGPPGDGARHARYPALPLLWPRLAPTCVTFLDDASRSDETEIIQLWLSEYPGLSSEQLSCEKGCVKLSKSKSE